MLRTQSVTTEGVTTSHGAWSPASAQLLLGDTRATGVTDVARPSMCRVIISPLSALSTAAQRAVSRTLNTLLWVCANE